MNTPKDDAAHVERITTRWSDAAIRETSRPSYDQGKTDIRLLLAIIASMDKRASNNAIAHEQALANERRYQRNMMLQMSLEVSRLANKYAPGDTQ